MKRTRVAGIIPIKDGFALMHRVGVKKNHDYNEYYTFPGGGLENRRNWRKRYNKRNKRRIWDRCKNNKKALWSGI